MHARSELDEVWKDTLLSQFHDCLPGTTITMVVKDNLDIYERREKQARLLIDQALERLAGSRPTDGDVTHVVDPLRLKRDEVIKLKSGREAWLRTNENGIGGLIDPKDGLQPPRAERQGDTWVLSNARFRLTIAEGRISSLVDLALDRELILAGPGAQDGGLMLYEDYPLSYDAWDVEIYHLQSCRVIPFEKVTAVQGSLRASLIATARFGKSTAKFTVSSFSKLEKRGLTSSDIP